MGFLNCTFEVRKHERNYQNEKSKPVHVHVQNKQRLTTIRGLIEGME